ncbi:MAG: SMC-Scp complex subunit ScpB [Gammaproteobacteria bacterium]|jgi:segregation and condensation protein B|nr:SMC-Scp complex subunit ScpB [Gammaproteobacteria bacterium]
MSEESQNTETNPFTKQIIEGLLLAAGKPLPMSKIAEVFPEKERPEPEELKAALKAIEEDCETRGFELKKVASGYRFQVKQEFGEWVGKLWDERPQRYSRALLETISIIAYRQPITRGEIEKIRGVAVSTNIIRTLIERDWVRVVGHRDVPGRPAMYATTKQFLDYFNLNSLEELPPLSEIRDLEELDPELSLEDDAQESRVLEYPSLEDMEDDFNVADEEEEMAAAIGTRPIEEILGIREEEPEEDWDDDDLDEPEDASVETDGVGEESAEESAEENAEESAEETTDHMNQENTLTGFVEAGGEIVEEDVSDSDDDEQNPPAG